MSKCAHARIRAHVRTQDTEVVFWSFEEHVPVVVGNVGRVEDDNHLL